MTNCLFCSSNGPFTTSEHIIPESLGNDDLILRGEVCDTCQNYFGKNFEKFVLAKTPLAFWRTYLGIKTKKGKLPTVNLSIPNKYKGTIPITSKYHDNEGGFTYHKDGSISVDIDDEQMIKEIIENKKDKFQFVFSPFHLIQLGRFFGKIGIELLCREDTQIAREEQFDDLRKYVRFGAKKEIWPLFHATKGGLRNSRHYSVKEGELLETVTFYRYSIGKFDIYFLLSFLIGTDLWVICLNNRYPRPIIREAFDPPVDLQLIWYESSEW